MKTIFTFIIILTAISGYTQDNSYNLFKTDLQKTNSKNAELKQFVDDALILNTDNDIYATIIEDRKNVLTLTIPVSANENIYLNLERFDILSPDAKIIEKSVSGERALDLRNIILSYKGTIAGDENSLVSISFYNGTAAGVIKSSREVLVIGAMNDLDDQSGDLIIFSKNKLKVKENIDCGSEAFAVPEEIVNTIRKIDAEPLDRGNIPLLVANIAIDVDFYTYGAYGNSVANASAYALAIMSATSAIYSKDLNVRLFVNYIRVWTMQDPYTSDDGGVLLDQFTAEWVANQGGVERVVAHLITRRPGINVGGIAYLNVLCNTSFGYGLSAINGIMNNLPAYSYDVVVVAHELGHNFGSPHTHSCSWVGGPIDTCYFTEGGCYNGPLHPTVGTIMSYCDTEGGTVIMEFGVQPEALMRNRAENAFCITTSDRTVFTAYPNGGETFRTSITTRIFWGTSLTGNVNIEFSTNNGSSWNVIQNNVPAQDREYAWTVPYIGFTDQARVRILNSANLSEGDTSDASFRIILNYVPFNLVSPPTLTRIETSPTGSSIHRFVWNNAGSHPSLRYKFKIRKIGAGGVDFIYESDNGGIDTAISLRNSFLDSIALQIGTVGDSIRCSWRGWAYNGYDSAQAANNFLVTLKRTGVGINMISSIIPEKFNLENNYPNPFNPTTIIKFDVAKLQNVKIAIFDMLGRQIENLVNEKLQPGSYEVSFNGSGYSTGVYYYRMETNDFAQTKKMLLLK